MKKIFKGKQLKSKYLIPVSSISSCCSMKIRSRTKGLLLEYILFISLSLVCFNSYSDTYSCIEKYYYSAFGKKGMFTKKFYMKQEILKTTKNPSKLKIDVYHNHIVIHGNQGTATLKQLTASFDYPQYLETTLNGVILWTFFPGSGNIMKKNILVQQKAYSTIVPLLFSYIYYCKKY